MCRNIKTLHNFDPPASDEEIHLSSLQFVRKLSGFTRPSKANQAAFDRAVDKVSMAARELIDSLVTNAPPRDREVEAVKARAKSAARFPSAMTDRAAKDVGSVLQDTWACRTCCGRWSASTRPAPSRISR